MISVRKPYLTIEDLSWLPIAKNEKVTILKILNRLVRKEVKFNYEIRLRLLAKIFEIHKNKKFYRKDIEKLTELNLDYVFYAVRAEIWSEFEYQQIEKQYEESEKGHHITVRLDMGSEEYTALPQTAYAVEVKNVYEDCAVSLTNEKCIEDSLAKAIASLSDEEQRIIRMNFYGDYKFDPATISGTKNL